MKFISLFLSTITTAFIIDITWIGLVAKNLYHKEIGMLLRKSGDTVTPIWWAGIPVYILITLGILFFVLPKAQGNYSSALIYGALFGAITYGVYDFTNYSVLAHWPLNITLIDFIWGTVLCALTSVLVTFYQHQFLS